MKGESTSLTGLNLICHFEGGVSKQERKFHLSYDRLLNGLVVEDLEDHSSHLVERHLCEPGFSLPDWPLRRVLVVVKESRERNSHSQVHQISCTIVSKTTCVLVVAHMRGPPFPSHSIDHAGGHSCKM